MSEAISSLEAEPRGAQAPATGQVLPLLADSVAHRAELAALELGEVRTHATDSAILAGATGALLLLAGFALTFLVAILVWESPHRAWWMAGLCVVLFSAAGVTGWLLADRLRNWRPFEATTTQIHTLTRLYCESVLQKDADALLRLYEERVRLFDMWNQPSVRGMVEWAPVVRQWLGGLGTESVHVEFKEVEIQIERDLAVFTSFVHYQARDSAGIVLRKMINRLTWALVRRESGWRILHQHTSIPIDSKTIAPKFNGAE